MHYHAHKIHTSQYNLENTGITVIIAFRNFLLCTNFSNFNRTSFINRMLDITLLIKLETAFQMKRFSFGGRGWGKISYCTGVKIYV